MSRILLVGAFFAFALPTSTATHDEGCVLTGPDPATVRDVHVGTPIHRIFYIEERGVPAPFNVVAISGTGLLLGEGTWVYEERNGVEGLQRGGTAPVASCIPPHPLPCLIITEDPITDENCGHGADDLVLD